MADTFGAVDAYRQSSHYRLHPPLATTSHFTTHQHFIGERLLYQTAQASHVVLRYKAHG